MTGEFAAALRNSQCSSADFGLIRVCEPIGNRLLTRNKLRDLQLISTGRCSVSRGGRQHFVIAAGGGGGLKTICVGQRRANGFQGVQLGLEIGIGTFLRRIGRDAVLKLFDWRGIQRDQLRDDRAGVDTAHQTDAGCDLTHWVTDPKSRSRFESVGDRPMLLFKPLSI